MRQLRWSGACRARIAMAMLRRTAWQGQRPRPGLHPLALRREREGQLAALTAAQRVLAQVELEALKANRGSRPG
eukprot:5551996-Alexandrium_andersonii.AAC.1